MVSLSTQKHKKSRNAGSFSRSFYHAIGGGISAEGRASNADQGTCTTIKAHHSSTSSSLVAQNENPETQKHEPGVLTPNSTSMDLDILTRVRFHSEQQPAPIPNTHGKAQEETPRTA